MSVGPYMLLTLFKNILPSLHLPDRFYRRNDNAPLRSTESINYRGNILSGTLDIVMLLFSES